MPATTNQIVPPFNFGLPCPHRPTPPQGTSQPLRQIPRLSSTPNQNRHKIEPRLATHSTQVSKPNSHFIRVGTIIPPSHHHHPPSFVVPSRGFPNRPVHHHCASSWDLRDPTQHYPADAARCPPRQIPSEIMILSCSGHRLWLLLLDSYPSAPPVGEQPHVAKTIVRGSTNSSEERPSRTQATPVVRTRSSFRNQASP